MNWSPPSTITTLKQQIERTNWFIRSRTFPEAANVIALRTLKTSESSNSDEWDWLPTTFASLDPIHIPELSTVARQNGRYDDYRIVVKEVYKVALVSLRKMDDHNLLFRVDASNVAPAVRGAALFAARSAAGEIVLEIPGFWCSIMPYYFNGYWPCGLADDKRLVIF